MSKLINITEASAEESAMELDFLESLKAGFPSPAADHTGERIDLVREMTPHPDTTFYARVAGDSMRDAGILDGDIAVVDRSLEPFNGNYVVAFIDNEFTLKEYRIDPNGKGAMLIPHNPEFQPIHISEGDNFRIWGVVTHVVHRCIHNR